MDGHASDGLVGQPKDQVARVSGEDRPVLLDGRRVELVVRHFAAGAPVLAVVHGAKCPSEAGPVDAYSVAAENKKLRFIRTNNSFSMIMRGLASKDR